MPQHLIKSAALALIVSACDGAAPAFSPAPESYSESRVAIEGVGQEQTIASVDSTFFGSHQPMLGRRFVREDHGGDALVAILGHRFWAEHFDARPEIIGTTLRVGGVVRTIVAVMSPGVDVPPNVALWIPRNGAQEGPTHPPITPGAPMYGLIGKITAVPGRRDALAAILLEGTRDMPGCVSYVVAADPSDPDALWVTEVWDSQASHEASLQLPAVQDAIAKGRPLIAGFSDRVETTPLGG